MRSRVIASELLGHSRIEPGRPVEHLRRFETVRDQAGGDLVGGLRVILNDQDSGHEVFWFEDRGILDVHSCERRLQPDL